MTTEERIAQIAQGFQQGIQNFGQAQQQVQGRQLAEEARRRQEALQAIEAAGALSKQTGRIVDPGAIQPLLASGDVAGLGALLSSGEKTPETMERERLAKRQAEMDALTKANLLSQINTREKTGVSKAPLEKLGADARSKVGSIASGLQALDAAEKALAAGYGPDYINPTTPFFGQFLSDDPFTEAQRVITEVTGRLQSGGAINADELKTFNALGPRPGDSPERRLTKLQQQRDFLKNKLTAFGLTEDDLLREGFSLKAQPLKMKDSGGLTSVGVDVPFAPSANDLGGFSPIQQATASDRPFAKEDTGKLASRREELKRKEGAR